MSDGLDYSKLSDEELKAIADGDYSKLSDKTLKHISESEPKKEAPTNEKELSGARIIGGSLGYDYGKDLSKLAGGAYAAKYATEKGLDLFKEKFPDFGKAPSVTVEAAPAQYNTPHGVGTGAVKNAEHNVGQIVKNKVAQAALETPGYTSPANSRILMPENVAAQIAKEAPAAVQTVAPAAEELSTLGKVKEAVGKVGNVLTPGGMAGKVLNTAAPMFSLAGAGALGADAAVRASHGDYGRAIVSGLGALGSAASMVPHPLTRAVGTGAALLAPAINYGIDTLYGREGYADGGEVGPYVGYPQINNKPRNPNFVQQSGPFLGGLDAIIGMGPRSDVSMLTPQGQAYHEAYQKMEPAGIAANVLPFIGGPTKALGKSAVRSLGPKAADMAENYLARIGGLQYAVPNETKIVRASEALAPHEGKWLNTTQSDRMRSTDGDLGGPGFSRFQNIDPAYKDAAWGVGKSGTATGIINLNQRFPEGKAIWAPMIGAETQHHSNQHVYDALTNEFNRQAATGKLTPELRAEMNARLTQYPEYASLFQKGIDVGNPEHLAQLGNTFDRRGAISTVISGKGVGGRKGQIFDYPGIMQEMTDPMTIGAPTHAVGTRLFTLNNEISHRPDLHSAFPYILHGKDQGVAFNPIPKELAIPDWLNLVQEFKGRPAGYMDFTRGLKGKGTPNQFISDKYLRNLEAAGHAEGGEVTQTPATNSTEQTPIISQLIESAKSLGHFR